MAGKKSEKEKRQFRQDSMPGRTVTEAELDAELQLAMEESGLHAIDDHEQPPDYDELLQEVNIAQDDFSASARILDDGRVNINIDDNRRISNLLGHQVKYATTETQSPPEADTPLSADNGHSRLKPPRLNIVIQVVGSRGDVQPFIALGRVLKEAFKHRVRVATHAAFQSLVEENGLEFFSLGGDPAALMAFLYKDFRLVPSWDSVKRGDVRKRKKEIFEMMKGCWRSCFEAGDNMALEGESWSGAESTRPRSTRAFVADAIIANPPSLAHVNCAQKLGIPLQLMFNIPWSPTQAFPHPLANIQPSKVDASLRNLVSYPMVEMIMWQGLGSTVNMFRSKILNLEPIRFTWGSQALSRSRIPYAYLWSPSLIPKPTDWGSHISVVGFPFLSTSSNYTPTQELQSFLDQGPPPIYIGFGSITIEDPPTILRLIFEAIRLSGQRAILSIEGGGSVSDSLPDGVFIVGNVPHDWLFQRVSCVVHHGGAGTTAAGIRFGKPAVIVPFFGDQFFWGDTILKVGAGPSPIPFRNLTPMKLAKGIQAALQPAIVHVAHELGQRVIGEDGAKYGAISFHQQIKIDGLGCSVDPSRPAVWRVRKTNVVLSAASATILIDAGILRFSDLKLYRHIEHVLEGGPPDPLTGATSAVLDMMGSMSMGFADMPAELARSRRSRLEKADRMNLKSLGGSNPTEPPLELYAPQDNDSSAGESRQRTISVQDGDSTLTTGVQLPKKSNESSSSINSDELCTLEAELSHMNDSGPRKASSRSVYKSKANSVVEVSGAAAYGSSKGLGRIMLAGFRSPFEVSLSVAKGFHNVPRLWGDETVRQPDRITGAWSGVKAAAKGLSFGVYDGVTGLVTQPVEGARQEGALGLAKGLGKGFGGVLMKPIAGSWGVLGYTYDGIDKEVQKLFCSNIDDHIIACRKAEGFEQVKSVSTEEKNRVTEMWYSAEIQTLKKKRKDKYHGRFNGAAT